jgi:K+-sensing histidine kinase KdpD
MMENGPSHKDIDLILAEKQKAIDKLRAENESLLKIISHDIRAPFTQLFAMMQLLDLEEGNISENQRHYFDRMYHSLASGMEMVKNLHDCRAIDKNNITVVSEELQLVPFIEKITQSFHKLARLKSIKLNFEKGSLNPVIETDAYILEKIFANVLSNTIKFPPNGSQVVIKLEKRGSNIITIFEDDGPGIPDNELSKIFEKYSKLSPKPSMGESTTGLGMYLSKYFAELINGHIEAENTTDSGLRVKIILPE